MLLAVASGTECALDITSASLAQSVRTSGVNSVASPPGNSTRNWLLSEVLFLGEKSSRNYDINMGLTVNSVIISQHGGGFQFLRPA